MMATARPGTKRRWFRFSLKTLLVMMTVLAVWLGLYAKKFRDRKEAVAAIETLDGAMGIKYLGPEWLRKLINDEKYFWDPAGVHFNEPLTDGDLDHVVGYLTHFQRLRDLTLQGSTITDNGLALLLPLREKLVWLDISNTPISDAAISDLKRFSGLRTLRLQNTRITPAGIAELQESLPNCKIDAVQPNSTYIPPPAS
jgi:hypothetical protein